MVRNPRARRNPVQSAQATAPSCVTSSARRRASSFGASGPSRSAETQENETVGAILHAKVALSPARDCLVTRATNTALRSCTTHAVGDVECIVRGQRLGASGDRLVLVCLLCLNSPEDLARNIGLICLRNRRPRRRSIATSMFLGESGSESLVPRGQEPRIEATHILAPKRVLRARVVVGEPKCGGSLPSLPLLFPSEGPSHAGRASRVPQGFGPTPSWDRRSTSPQVCLAPKRVLRARVVVGEPKVLEKPCMQLRMPLGQRMR